MYLQPVPLVSARLFVLSLEFNQNCVLSYTDDAVPGNHKVEITAEKTQVPAWARNNYRRYPAAGQLNQHVLDKAQPVPVADIYYVLAPQVCNFALMHIIPPELKAGSCRLFNYISTGGCTMTAKHGRLRFIITFYNMPNTV